jgi:hypothetical protein
VGGDPPSLVIVEKDCVMCGTGMLRMSVTATLLALLVVGLASNSQAMEQKRYWKGTTVGLFMDIEGQQFSYVAGFLDNAVYAYHALGVSALKWQIDCLADHPNRTNPVEITRSIIKKFEAIAEDFTPIRDMPVGHFIDLELGVRCGKIKQ